jgi:arylsulfatase A-like enzyme
VHRQEYYAIITHMDVQLGRILDALEKSGKTDNHGLFSHRITDLLVDITD